MKLISILNVYGMENIGDAAIYQSAIQIINESVDEEIFIHTHAVSTDIPDDISNLDKVRNTNMISPYGYAIANKNNKPIPTCNKILNFISVLLVSIFLAVIGKINSSWLPKKGFYFFITSIYKSDAVINIGGGYLRTKNSFKDFFGLILILLPIFIARFYNKRLLFLPMSFGNFANRFHEGLCAKAIKGSIFIARDNISFRDISKYENLVEDRNTKIIYLPDMALFLNRNLQTDASEKFSKDYVAITAREWMTKEKQEKYEKALIKIIDYMYERYNLPTVFLPMVHNEIEDNDFRVARRIQKKVKLQDSFSIAEIELPNQVQDILAGAKFSICTRMHSAILSATVLTPHIGIAYEHKMHGYMDLMGLSDWVTDIKDVSFEFLTSKVDKIILEDEFTKYFKYLQKQIDEVQKYRQDLVKITKEFIY